MKAFVLAFLFASSAVAAPALAETRAMRDLLADGFDIKAADVVPQEFLQRSIDPTWRDGYLITLQKEGQIAICHSLLSATHDVTSLMEVLCTVSAKAASAN
jgi:hypothetical protein